MNRIQGSQFGEQVDERAKKVSTFWILVISLFSLLLVSPWQHEIVFTFAFIGEIESSRLSWIDGEGHSRVSRVLISGTRCASHLCPRLSCISHVSDHTCPTSVITHFWGGTRRWLLPSCRTADSSWLWSAPRPWLPRRPPAHGAWGTGRWMRRRRSTDTRASGGTAPQPSLGSPSVSRSETPGAPQVGGHASLMDSWHHWRQSRADCFPASKRADGGIMMMKTEPKWDEACCISAGGDFNNIITLRKGGKNLVVLLSQPLSYQYLQPSWCLRVTLMEIQDSVNTVIRNGTNKHAPSNTGHALW